MRSCVSRSVPSRREIELASRARELRCAATPSEAALWAALRGNALGVAFKRQVVVGQFIVDFLAPSMKVAVEVDGGSHQGRAARDARKDRVLRRMGYRVMRVEAELVLRDLAEAVARVREALEV